MSKIPKNRYYIDHNKKRKVSGIYCPSFDRLLLIDLLDQSITMKTAQVLSSKVASTVYLFSKEHQEDGIENSKSLNLTLGDKTDEKRGTASILYSGQIPIMKVLGPGSIVSANYPPDFSTEDRKPALENLKEYAHFVHRMMYAITISQYSRGFYDNQSFSREFFPSEWLNERNTYADISTFDDGIMTEIKRVLYFADGVQDAKEKIERVWLDGTSRMNTIKDKFYEIYEAGNDDYPVS